ncbi:MAG: transposase [Bacteroidota bacterium]
MAITQMKFDPHKHHRRSIRLKGYDYSQEGGYFITICTHHKNDFFGTIENSEMRYSPIGKIAGKFWNNISKYNNEIELDEFIVMPNHVHGIIIKLHDAGLDGRGVLHTIDFNDRKINLLKIPPANNPPNALNAPFTAEEKTSSYISPNKDSLAVLVRTYKMAVTKWCRKNGHEDFAWQRNYHEHIIRGEKDLRAIRNYIIQNPLKWALDENNPNNDRKGKR